VKQERLRRAEENEAQQTVSDKEMVKRFSNIGANAVDVSTQPPNSNINAKTKRKRTEGEGGSSKTNTASSTESISNQSFQASRFKFLKPTD
jgi:hypothetical protein